MQVHAQATLVEALAAWGAYEASGRAQQQFPGQINVDVNDPLACVEFILWYRARVITALLARVPQMTLKATFNATDISKLVLFDGRTLDAWISETNIAGGESQRYFKDLAQGSTPLQGSLLVAAQLIAPPPDLQFQHQILYEGWHRAAAITERAQAGFSDTIDAYIVLTAM